VACRFGCRAPAGPSSVRLARATATSEKARGRGRGLLRGCGWGASRAASQGGTAAETEAGQPGTRCERWQCACAAASTPRQATGNRGRTRRRGTGKRITREIIAHYKKTSCFVYTFYLAVGVGLSLSPFHLANTYNSIVGDTCDVSVPRDSFVKITRKTSANFAPLNSSIAFRDLRLGGCLQAPGLHAPARAQSPTRNTRIKRRKFRRSFWGPGSGVYVPHTSECTVRALCMIVDWRDT
jgi:hypothetical protein